MFPDTVFASEVMEMGECFRSWASLNPSSKKYFTVIDDVNLNQIPNVLFSSSYFKNKKLLRGVCGAGSLRLVAFTDRYGYCPGETIYITVSCTNNSLFTVRKVVISLQQLVIYTSSTGHRKCQWNCLLSSTKGGCSRQGGVFGVSHLPLHIPSIPMTCGEHTCRCISTSYSIKLVIYTSSTGHRKCQWNCLLSSTKGGCSRQGGVFGVSHLPLHIPSIPMTCGEHTCRCISTSYSIKIKFRIRKGLAYTVDLPVVIGSIPISIFASLKHGIIHPRPTHLECAMKGGSIEDDDDVTNACPGDACQLHCFTPAYTYYDWRGHYPAPHKLPYVITGNKLLKY
ncbi:uncharacterized protein LOC134844749 [Symsagittifera roscoffensis]|uniref:uncharacterized protein LOC134844749 n=1 Tax=Symsagittifera roscoffensis TaxID=84072 RepID=UPI00307C3CC1